LLVNRTRVHLHVEKLSHGFSRFFTTNSAFYFGVIITVLWIASWFGDKHWHELLVESVGILSFMTIFSFQRSQSKDTKAIQLKLDELLASSDVASNRLIKAEEAPEHVLDQVHEIYKDVARAAMEEESRMSMVVGTTHAETLMEALHLESIETHQEHAATDVAALE
jgi:low affinity Fe/Cu permease